MVSFDSVWNRIEKYSGQVFRQIRGGEFTYIVKSGALVADRTSQQIPRSERAFKLVPLDGTSSVQSLRGPSYIYAVLMDQRIRQRDW